MVVSRSFTANFGAISRPSYRHNPKEGSMNLCEFTTQSALAGFPPDVAKGSAGECHPSLRSLFRLIKLMDTYYRGCPANGCSSPTSIDPPVSASVWNSSTEEGILIRIRKSRPPRFSCSINQPVIERDYLLFRASKNSLNKKCFFFFSFFFRRKFQISFRFSMMDEFFNY